MDFTKTINSLKLLLATVLVGSASLSANADTITFQDEATGLYFSSSNGTTCSVIEPTDNTIYSFENGDVVIPSTVTYNGTEYKVTAIAHAAFMCSTLTSISIPQSVTSIGSYAFYVCPNLTSISILGDITSIGSYTFSKCSSLSSVTLPESINSIGNMAFNGCSSLTSFTMPKNVKSINIGAFGDCTSLDRVDISDLEAWCKIHFNDGPTSNPTYYAHHLYLNDSLLTNIVIPESITAIRNYTFINCRDIEYLDLGENITSIGYDSFAGCKKLKGTYTNKFTPDEYKYVLEIPNSIETIKRSAFFACSSIENIWIGTGCTSIDQQAFDGNGNLKSVTCLAYPAPALARQDVFNDEDYTNAYLYISAGETDEETQAIYNSYVDENNYWRLFLKGTSTIDGEGNEGGISVGVDEVANDNIAVTTDGKVIEITGYEGEVNVYNVAGMRVYQGNDNRIELPNAGIYVVVVNGKSYKVAIK